MPADLDARGRSAAAAVRAALADAPAPGLDLAAAPRPDRQPVLVAATLLLVAGAVALVLLLGTDGEDRSGVATEGGGDVPPRYVLDRPPAGMSAESAWISTGSPDEAGVLADLWVYGDPDADDPFAEVDLGIGVLRVVVDRAEVADLLPDGPPVDVGGADGWLVPEETSVDGRTSLLVPVDDATMVSVSSASLDQAALVEVAASLSGVTPLPEPDPEPVPGLRLVAAAREVQAAPGYSPLPSRSHAFVRYADRTSASRSVSLVAVRVTPEELLARRWSQAPVATRADIGGAEAWVIGEGVAGGEVSWVADDGTLLVLRSYGFGEEALRVDELVSAAASARLATDAEWADLERGVPGFSDHEDLVGGAEPEAVLRGQLSDGTSWAVIALDNGSFLIEPDGGAVGFLRAGPGSGPDIVASTHTFESGDVLLFGRSTVDLLDDDIVLALADPAEVDDHVGVPAGPFLTRGAETADAVFAWAYPPGDAVPEVLVARDRWSGDELARADVAPPRPWRGSPPG